MAFNDAGILYIADTNNNRIRTVNAAGNTATVVGNSQGFSGDNGLAASAQLNNPRDVAFDNTGNLYIADTINNRIRKVDVATNIITTIAGDGTAGFAGDSGPAISARLSKPSGLTFDSSGNLYIADTGNHSIRVITSGTITTVIAGSGTKIDDVPNPCGNTNSAPLNFPRDVTFDASGTLYVADTCNHRVVKVDGEGKVTNVAGSTKGFSGDGQAAINAKLDEPHSIAFGPDGNLYITDADIDLDPNNSSVNNDRIRKVTTTSGTIITVVGNGQNGTPGGGDNGPAIAAQIDSPRGLAFKGEDLYLSEAGPNGNRVRLVDESSSTSSPTPSASVGPTTSVSPTVSPVSPTTSSTTSASSSASPSTSATSPSPSATASPSPSISSSPTLTSAPPTSAPVVYYENCDAVRAAGKAPLYRGNPGYRAGLDSDNDGIACEVRGNSTGGDDSTSQDSTTTTSTASTKAAAAAAVAETKAALPVTGSPLPRLLLSWAIAALLSGLVLMYLALPAYKANRKH